MNNYTIEQLTAGNIHYLCVLFESVYKKKCPPTYFHLKYNTAYTGVENIGFICFKEKEPIAFYGVVPVRVSINSSVVLAAQSCDTMTHPEYRKKGLFVKLALLSFDLAQKHGIHFIFGFPNQNSYPAFIEKLEFSHKETLIRFTVPFSDNLFKKTFRKFIGNALRKDRILIENDLLKQGYDGVIYDTAYFNYKRYNPNFTISFANQTVWINNSNNSLIGAMTNVEAVFEQLSYIKNITKASSFTFMVSPHTNMHAFLSRTLKPEDSFPVITNNLSNIYSLDKLKFQFADIDIF